MKVKLNVKIDKSKVRQLDQMSQIALGETCEQLRADVYNAEVMPRDTGTLQNESTWVDRSELANRKVRLVHSTPYARRLYFNPQFNFRTDKNANARGHWLDDWISGSKKDFCKTTLALIYRQLLSRK